MEKEQFDQELRRKKAKFNRAFRLFLATGKVTQGYQYIDRAESGRQIQAHFVSDAFELDMVWYCLLRARHRGIWDKQARLWTPSDKAIDKAIEKAKREGGG